MPDGFTECEALVRRDDPDRAVAVAFAARDRWPYLNALYAFDIETARIRQIVSQPLPGEIRLQWWRDRIEAHAADPLEASGQGSPVAAALLETIATCDLPASAFETLLDARIFDLYDDPMPGRAELEAYAGETASAVLMLAAMVLDREGASAASEAAGHAGVTRVVAEAVTLLDRRPAHAQIFFPTDILDAVGCAREALSGDDEERRRAVAAMAAFGLDHAAKARAAAAALPRSLKPVFLTLDPIETSLRRANSPGPTLGRAAPLRRLFSYWRAMRR
ncbi:squalene/phytoene synthase family protein [Aureimonas leprariae]|uniref:Phytoene/squalene synthase family protein n=1 Tax=Plantimonas leprariae TaxID=2615207 RepID=A0A7V7PS94_9HYPH|nr:squalene/phytoene synthase family protein [Aureimonas leprariae]KAB0681974.1 phytoene/squalene synthase family protein [Aureimonas leprariae]